MRQCANPACRAKFKTNWTQQAYCKFCRKFLKETGRFPSADNIAAVLIEEVTGLSSRLDGPSPGEVAETSPGAARGLHLSPVAARLSAEEVTMADDRCKVSEAGSAMLMEAAGKMAHDPDDEVTVISENGVGKGILSGNTIKMVGTVDLTPTPAEIANLVRYVQAMHREGNHVGAFNMLSAGWPQMRIGQAVKLLYGSITLEEALSE